MVALANSSKLLSGGSTPFLQLPASLESEFL
jgi:hypothetical protein